MSVKQKRVLFLIIFVLVLTFLPDKTKTHLYYQDQDTQQVAVTWDFGNFTYFNQPFCPVWRDDPLHDGPTWDGWLRGWGYSGILYLSEHWQGECNLPGPSEVSHTYSIGWRPGLEEYGRFFFGISKNYLRVGIMLRYYEPLIMVSYQPRVGNQGYRINAEWWGAPWCNLEHLWWTCRASKQEGEPWCHRSAGMGPPQ